MRMISFGGKVWPHSVQVVFSAARTASMLILPRGVTGVNDSRRQRRIQGESTYLLNVRYKLFVVHRCISASKVNPEKFRVPLVHGRSPRHPRCGGVFPRTYRPKKQEFLDEGLGGILSAIEMLRHLRVPSVTWLSIHKSLHFRLWL